MLEAIARANFDRDVAAIDVRAAERRGWRIVEATYPVLDVIFTHPTAKALRLKFVCTDWNEVPPSIVLLDQSGAFLQDAPPNTNYVFNPSPHPSTGRPFVCMRGSHEYHTHYSHITDNWDNYRGQPSMNLGGIAFQLWKVWKRSVG